MKYEIRLSGSEQDGGKIESRGRNQSAQSIIMITRSGSNAKPLTCEQQVQNALSDPNYKNRMSEIVGQWPGDETIEEILAGLD
jgi:hypothetical protein